MNVVVSTPVALVINFLVGSTPVAPDVGSVSYSVFDQAGTVVPGLLDLPVATTPTTYQTPLLIPGSANTISAGRRFERRKVVISFEVGGQAVQITKTYRITPDLPHSVTPQSVRAFIGIEAHELPDEDIDIFSAYLAVEDDVSEATLAAALVSGTREEFAANTLVEMRTVLSVLPSAKQRMAQSEKNGVKEFSRVDLKELDKLAVEAERRYNEALDKVVVTTETSVSLFLTTTNIDAITGA